MVRLRFLGVSTELLPAHKSLTTCPNSSASRPLHPRPLSLRSRRYCVDKKYSFSKGVLAMHWIVAFMKQVLPKFRRPVAPRIGGVPSTLSPTSKCRCNSRSVKAAVAWPSDAVSVAGNEPLGHSPAGVWVSSKKAPASQTLPSRNSSNVALICSTSRHWSPLDRCQSLERSIGRVNFSANICSTSAIDDCREMKKRLLNCGKGWPLSPATTTSTSGGYNST
mmetsp:Transcript_53862/g.155537  ORF Transcript_53862/g.155537 Transcript_53862/m.155537 type:complete len:221 (+) Transcript_53862:311-973(+)